jgi:hypothetical protein
VALRHVRDLVAPGEDVAPERRRVEGAGHQGRDTDDGDRH